MGLRTVLAAVDRAIARLVVVFFRAYRALLSPILGRNCRFEPSCSRYAEQAIEIHGAWTGGWVALKRLFRCHPWGAGGGFDPVS